MFGGQLKNWILGPRCSKLQPPFYFPSKVRNFRVIFVIRVPSKPLILVSETILQSA